MITVQAHLRFSSFNNNDYRICNSNTAEIIEVGELSHKIVMYILERPRTLNELYEFALKYNIGKSDLHGFLDFLQEKAFISGYKPDED